MEINIKCSEVGGYKIFKIGGFVVRGRGYSQTPPASKLKSQTPPPHPQKIKFELRSNLILKKARIGCRRTTATHADTPKACVNLMAAKGAAQGVSYYVTSNNYQKR